MEAWWMVLLGAALIMVAHSSPNPAPQSVGGKPTPPSAVTSSTSQAPQNDTGPATGPSGSPATGPSGSPDCDCDYHSEGGCAISDAAPKGFACVCVQKPFWRCTGWARGCSAAEHCPGAEYSKEACHLGGGNCLGYP